VSRAFVKEPDGDTPELPKPRRGVPLPSDVPNYVTASGARALRAELEAGASEDRTHEIADHLATAVVMEPPSERSRVGFGATVTVEDDDGGAHVYRIVGAVEAAPKQGAIYWKTPIALALYDAEVGDSVTLPKGDVEIVKIEWG
jgi:transcription elongation factor GreB